MAEIKTFQSALQELADILKKNGIPYMVIGGVANAVWGNPRATLDIDVTIWVEKDKVAEAVSALGKRYTFLVENPDEFIAETRVLPVRNSENFRIDIIFGALPFEKEAIERAENIMVGERPIKFCTAEDLILLKIISERSQDIEDVRQILSFQKQNLDYDYLEPRIEELSNLLGRPGILEKWEAWKTNTLFN